MMPSVSGEERKNVEKMTRTILTVAQRTLSEPGRYRTPVAIGTACAYLLFYTTAFLTGGLPPVYIALNFFFILLAAVAFALPGALVAATASAILLGPLITNFIDIGRFNFQLGWIARSLGFELFGLFSGLVSVLLRYQASLIRDTTEQSMRAQKMEAVGQLAAGIAHDFNNVLTVVVGFTEVALSTLDLNHSAHRSLTHVLKAAQKGASLSHQLLAFSRRQILQPSVLNLNDVIQDLRAMLERLAGVNITVSATLDPQLAPIEIDRSQLEQIIMNLAVNACDAISGAGNILLATQNLEVMEQHPDFPPEILPGGYVQLSVMDTGKGMSEQVAARVFEPFYTSKPQGSGLGLATVYGIVKQSRGYIYVHSQEGSGTTFDLFFPQKNLAPSLSPQLATPADGDIAGKETALLVEHQEELANLMESTLSAHGYTVRTERTAEMALKSYADGEVKPDLLITDITLPGLDGIQLSQRLSAQLPNLKTLFVTGSGRDYEPPPIQSNGRSAVLRKPYGSNDLLRAAKALLNRAPSTETS